MLHKYSNRKIDVIGGEYEQRGYINTCIQRHSHQVVTDVPFRFNFSKYIPISFCTIYIVACHMYKTD